MQGERGWRGRFGRREVLRWGALGVSAAALRAAPGGHFVAQEQPVTEVLLVSKCHLDVGFTDTQQRVMERYFKVYYPQAMATARKLREAGSDRYTWTTGSWLLYEYLEQASADERRAMEKAVVAGDIAWGALPFSWQTEMLTPSLIAGALGFSAELDRRFGTKTTGAKMTDVPGHTRGLVGPLADGGVRLVDIGVNAASTPPEVPDVFLWKDGAGKSLAVMYHLHDYGSVVRVPGTSVAVAVEVRTDNSGPHTPEEIAGMYAELRKQFPGATVRAATLSDVAAAVEPVRDRLPVVRQEIGDTWIYGVASDPEKVARAREAVRVRQEWLNAGRLKVGDATDRQMLRRLLLSFEHTWGTDTKRYVDHVHYRPADLERHLQDPGYQTMEHSWQEKRDDLTAAEAGLPDELRREMRTRVDSIGARRPDRAGLRAQGHGRQIMTKHFMLQVDAGTGALVRLQHRASGREWASATHPLALLTYQTLSAEEYATFLRQYLKSSAEWAPQDFGKPGIEKLGARSQEWHPRLVGVHVGADGDASRVVLEWAIRDAAAEHLGNVAFPREAFCELRFPPDAAAMEVTVTTLGKAPNRMPEALWLTFAPETRAGGTWVMQKAGEAVAVDDVVRGGGRSMHAVEDRIEYREGGKAAMTIRTLDAPMVAVSGRLPLNFSLEQPDLAGGVHVGLFNNAWGTNYVQWIGGDWQYRFRVEVG